MYPKCEGDETASQRISKSLRCEKTRGSNK